MMNLVSAIEQGLTLPQIVRRQHEYHEYRRWSVFDVLKQYDDIELDRRDRVALWHIARGELTTMSGGIGLAKTALEYARELGSTNRVGATVLHAAATWIARYWLEEEAHHEVAYGTLLDEVCGDAIPDDDLMRHRGLFPTDNFLRNLMLQACVEVEVAVTYAEAAKTTTSPLMREFYTRISRDEVQHRQYFVSFAQGLVDAGVYPAKDALAMAFHWVRPSGELYGSTRSAQSTRTGYVNWWETVRVESDDPNAITQDQHFAAEIFAKKTKSVLKAVHQVTGQDYETVDELKKAYFRSLREPSTTNSPLARVDLAASVAE